MSKPRQKKPARQYAAIDHEVLDSKAWGHLSPSACKVLMVIVRQESRDNNGRLQATHSYMSYFGGISTSTLRESIKSLIAHGLIYRTRGRGMDAQGKNVAALYALTWRPLTSDRRGLSCDGFVAHAYRKWVPEEKFGVSKIDSSCSDFQQSLTDEGGANPVAKINSPKPALVSKGLLKIGTYEVVPVYRGLEAQTRPQHSIASTIRKGSFAHIASVKTGYQNRVRCVTARPAQTIH